MKKPIPLSGYNGITLEQWQSDPERVRWAQAEPRFKEVLAVIVNESYLAFAPVPGASEPRLLGRVEGFNMPMEILRQMARRPMKAIAVVPADYVPETDSKPEPDTYSN